MGRRKLLLSLLLSLICGLWSHIVWAEDLPAQSVLSNIVEREFNGDITARRGRVIFTDGKGSKVGSCDCSMPRESWDLDEEYVIVSTWDVAGAQAISADKTTIEIRYHVIGKSVMSDSDDTNRVPGRLRIISAPHQPYDEIVSYKLMHKKTGVAAHRSPAP